MAYLKLCEKSGEREKSVVGVGPSSNEVRDKWFTACERGYTSSGIANALKNGDILNIKEDSLSGLMLAIKANRQATAVMCVALDADFDDKDLAMAKAHGGRGYNAMLLRKEGIKDVKFFAQTDEEKQRIEHARKSMLKGRFAYGSAETRAILDAEQKAKAEAEYKELKAKIKAEVLAKLAKENATETSKVNSKKKS